MVAIGSTKHQSAPVTPAHQPNSLLSEDRLHSLALTYSRVETPVWIDNLRGDCIYANPPAERISASSPKVFDIIDHDGRMIGRLRTMAS
ncbi:MAG: hypothetical protein FWC56_05935 [Phycisphaerae bacterium]|nr:hypothetical protein [Phycisphaerae bacterium]